MKDSAFTKSYILDKYRRCMSMYKETGEDKWSFASYQIQEILMVCFDVSVLDLKDPKGVESNDVQSSMPIDRVSKMKILLTARSIGYKLHRKNDWNYVLKKQDPEHGNITFNVFWNRSNNKFTVQTTLSHPVKGRNQLNRKYIDLDLVLVLLASPRKHTGQGYRRKKKKS